MSLKTYPATLDKIFLPHLRASGPKDTKHVSVPLLSLLTLF